MSGKDLVAMDKGGGANYLHCVEEMYNTVEGILRENIYTYNTRPARRPAWQAGGK
jgi:hypothetical protein